MAVTQKTEALKRTVQKKTVTKHNATVFNQYQDAHDLFPLSSLRISLQDCDGIEHGIKAKAEARFAKVIERSFPNEEAMTRAYKLFDDAAEGSVISKADEKQRPPGCRPQKLLIKQGFRVLLSKRHSLKSALPDLYFCTLAAPACLGAQRLQY